MKNRVLTIHFMLFLAFAVLPLNIYGQDRWRANSYLRPWADINSKACIIKFQFKDTTGKSKLKFKRIMSTWYESEDSTLMHKRITKKFITTFNTSGEPILSIAKDSLGKTTDSTIVIYEVKDNQKEEIGYNRDNPDGELKVAYKEFMTVNKNGEIVQDSDIIRNTDTTKKNQPEFLTESYKRTYDKAGNLIEIMRVYITDTTIKISEYDNKNREISNRIYFNKVWSLEKKIYKDNETELEEIFIKSPVTQKGLLPPMTIRIGKSVMPAIPIIGLFIRKLPFIMRMEAIQVITLTTE